MTKLDNDNTFFYKQNELRCKEPKVGRPLFCDLLISERCNLQCKKCYFWKHGIKNELTIEECKAFVLYLKDLVQMPFEINLGGGEPLLKEGIFDLSRYCADQGFQPVISTNGTLIDKKMAKRIFESGLHRLSLSLDTMDEKTHDFLTGTKGSYKRVMNAIDCLRKYCNNKVDLNIHSVILEQNIDQIIDLVEWVNNDDIFTGISFQALAQPFRTDLVDRWYLESEHSFLWPKDSKKVTSLIETLIKYKKQKYKILNPIPQLSIYKGYYENPEKLTGKHDCKFGDYIFNVNAFGYIHLCCFMEPIGDIRKINIKDAWYSEESRETRKRMHNCQKSCNNIINCYFQEGGKAEEVKALIEDGVEHIASINKGVQKIRLSDIKPASIASVDLLMTSYCMLKCKMCYLWERKRDFGELRIEEWKNLVNVLRLIMGDKYVRLHLGGGEPLTKEGITDLIKFSVQKGFYTLVTTNGFLIDKEMAHKISDSGLSHITISLDSLKEKVHDYLRGAKGTYRRVFNAFDYLSKGEKKISIGINCLISDVNLDGILPLARWALDDERISGVIFQAVVQPYETAFEHEWHKNSVFSELWPKDNSKVERIIDQLIDLKANTKKGKEKITNSIGQFKVFKEYFRNPCELIEKKACPMDGSSLLVNWKGDTYFCGMLKPMGNVRHASLEDIMSSSLAEESLMELKKCRRNCNNKVNCFYKDEQ
ncbi:radical SAM protein [Candidatus Omnitrophota bacterium]